MRKQVSDEQLDAVLKGLFAESAISEEKVNEIADSPAIWWSVQRRIAEQKPESKSPWPPIAKFWQLLKFGVPALAAIALLMGVFIFRPADRTPDKAAVAPGGAEPVAQTSSIAIEPPAGAQPSAVAAVPASTASETKNTVTSAHARLAARTFATAKRPALKNKRVMPKTEIKSEFIALSYARDADSGQIIRVKVPSSMMVTLGLAVAVEKPTALVDAEVIVGDDGLTRAIRFIR